jgi:DUF177 domain-containing protein
VGARTGPRRNPETAPEGGLIGAAERPPSGAGYVPDRSYALLVSVATHDLDLAGLRLSSGEGRRVELAVQIEPIVLGGERYAPSPKMVPVALDVSRMTGLGLALRLRFSARLTGSCMRCLKEASPMVEVDAREIDVPGETGDLSSPYVHDQVLDIAAWAHDAFALAAPAKVLCRDDCAGLCPECAADLNEAGPEHRHERPPDPRFAKLSELKLQ